jgi:Schlafen, AlbA_2
MDLQELVTRARFIFSNAPERLKVFQLINGRRNTADIARRTRRHVNNVRRDLKLLEHAGIVQPKPGPDARPLKVGDLPIYERVPLARAVPPTYFHGPSSSPSRPSPQLAEAGTRPAKARKPKTLPLPTGKEVLDICRHGEDQTYEFKGRGTKADKIAREVAAMLNTRQGGIIFYGVDDSGAIQGSDISRQGFDQPLQNSARNTISPPPVVKLHAIAVMGSEILAVVVPPWNKKDVYQYDGRVLLRKGTNVFYATPGESRKLHRGQHVV